ncbi:MULTISPECIES: DUF4334 domain-containing protein [unclassified Mycobacterium]|uniref:DUF4334 domain-containing protein n=1 Tax=unclassified Mycobacterium TaxID=2642494 RepID=UPI00048BBE79|nr:MULTISPECIES: DUF4334 domain-containing protein [unclassified Mycobacterium]SEA61658.1 GXWXG protein [Mycobacterium sp. 283mftsu]
MTIADTAAARFHQLRAQDGDVSPAALDDLWAQLPAVRAEDILGAWKGGEFRTGHPLNGMLATFKWFGKTMNSLSDVQPNMCYDENGELYSNVEIGNGEASLWNVEFRGEVTATMVYDGRPVFDHFKRVDDNTLMGIMNAKDINAIGGYFYFLLERA